MSNNREQQIQDNPIEGNQNKSTTNPKQFNWRK